MADETVSLKEFVVSLLEAQTEHVDDRLSQLASTLEMLRGEVAEMRRQHLEQYAVFAHKTDIAAANLVAERAIQKAEIAAEKRFEAMNEFRGQLADQQATLVRKAEVDLRFDALDKKVDAAVAQLQLQQGRESGVSLSGHVLSVILSLVFTAAALGIMVWNMRK